jgi:hypothetical protein
MKSFIHLFLIFFFIIFINVIFIPSTSLAEDKLSALVSSTSKDYTSTQGVFSPGPDFRGVKLNDFEWTTIINLDKPKTIASILIEHYVGGEAQAWTTTSKRYFGKDIYPIVVLKDGEQLNTRYDQTIGPLQQGTHKLMLYGQMESSEFYGGKITIEFLDGETCSANIPVSNIAPSILSTNNLSCSDSDEGATYHVKGTINYSTGNGKSYSYIDTCIDKTRVAEGMCGGIDLKAKQFVISHGLCKEGCKEGRCITNEQTNDYSYKLTPVSYESISATCPYAWELRMNFIRQKSIQYLLIKPSDTNSVFLTPRLFYWNDAFVPNFQINDKPFEPGEHRIIICLPNNHESYKQGLLRVVFADGSRFDKTLE